MASLYIFPKLRQESSQFSKKIIHFLKKIYKDVTCHKSCFYISSLRNDKSTQSNINMKINQVAILLSWCWWLSILDTSQESIFLPWMVYFVQCFLFEMSWIMLRTAKRLFPLTLLWLGKKRYHLRWFFVLQLKYFWMMG